MKNIFRGKVGTAIILLATFILAGIAIFTAIRLYQLRQTSISPAAPSSVPHAQEVSSCSLTFSINVASTGSPTSSPTSSPTESPTGSPEGTTSPSPTNPSGTPNSCGGTCGSNFNCASNLVCYQGFCRNPSCTSSTNCVCAGTPAPTTTPPTLPQSGTDWPTYAGAGLGIFVIVTSLLLAL